MANVTLRLYSPDGLLLIPSVTTDYIEWTLKENTFGVLRATGPLVEMPPEFLTQDARIEVMRQVGGNPPYVEGETQYLLKYWNYGENDAGAETWEIEAYTLDFLLTGRFVDSWASTKGSTNPLTTKTDYLDDMAKEIVSENMVSASETTRNITGFTVEPDTSDLVSISKSFSWRNIQDLLLEMSEQGSAAGSRMVYAIVPSSPGATTCAFRTFPLRRGMDHTSGTADEVVVSKAMGNLRLPRISYDHREEYTAVRIGGAGQGKDRVTVRVIDADRSTASPYAYREKFIENTQTTSTTILTADANAELQRLRPRRKFTGQLVDTDYARYGERVNFGDLVTVEYKGLTLDCGITEVKGTHTRDDGEILEINLISVEAL